MTPRRVPGLGTSRHGFTLVEAICAIVIVAIAVPPLLWSLRDAQTLRAAPTLAARAQWLALEKIEDVLADRASASRGYAYITAANYPPEPVIAGFPGFSRQVSVATTGVNFAAGSGWKAVSVSVSWRDGRNVLRTVSLSALITEYTP